MREPAQIAVVEDDPGVSRLLALLLGERGYRVSSFPDGEAALTAFLEQQPPDLAIVDWSLPGMSGIALVRALRARYDSRRLPIVVVSGYSAEDDAVEGLQAGADDFLAKPLNDALLQLKVERLLDVRRAVPHELPGATLRPPCPFGPFSLVGPLNAGPGRRVYEGRDPAGGRVAVELLGTSCQVESDAVGRLQREVAAARAVASPHLAPPLEAGRVGCHHYLASGFVAGETAQARLERAGPLPLDVVLRVGRGLLDALRALAQAGLFHRDVKPANVVLTPEGEPVLVGLGLAKSLLPGLTGSWRLRGTLPFLAPEVVLGEPDYPELDLYGLGVTLHTLLTGAPPFRVETVPELVWLATERPPAPQVTAARPDVPSELARAIASLHEPARPLRLRSFAAAIQALEAAAPAS